MGRHTDYNGQIFTPSKYSPNDPEILDAKEAAEYLRISIVTIYRNANKFPRARICGRWKFKKTDLDRLFVKAEK